MLLGPKGSYNWSKFYVQTDNSWIPGSLFWYTNRPVGKNTITEYMKKIMEAGGIEGFYHNHSLRITTATCLFEKGLDPQLIQGQTGHKSNAIMLYKQSNLDMKKQVSDMLNILPREMEAIRQKENVMQDREKQFERSKQVTIAKNDDKHEETEIKEKNSTSNMTQSAVQKVKMESKPQVVVDKKGLDITSV